MITYQGISIDRDKCTVSHRGHTHQFAEKRGGAYESILFRLTCALILGPGFSKEQLFWMFYGNDPDGGPLSAANIFSVRMTGLRPVWRALDLDLRRWPISGVIFYSLSPVTKLSPRPLFEDRIRGLKSGYENWNAT